MRERRIERLARRMVDATKGRAKEATVAKIAAGLTAEELKEAKARATKRVSATPE